MASEYTKKTRARRRRAKIINALGACCACCGETSRATLTIDHIDDDGAQERREIPELGDRYGHMIAQGCPPDRYQILCQNCHQEKNTFGVCSHASTVAQLTGLLTWRFASRPTEQREAA